MSTRIYSKPNFSSKFIHCFDTPSKAMITTWLIWLALYLTVPFYYTNSISLMTAALIFLSIGFFVFGDLLSKSVINKINSRKPRSIDNDLSRLEITGKYSPRIDRLVSSAALVGLIGASIVVIIKTLISGLDFSAGISAARVQRANEVITGTVESSPLFLYPALLTFPFGTASFLSGILDKYSLSKKTLITSKIAILAPVSVTVVSGGRGGILHVVLMGLSAIALLSYSQQKKNYQFKIRFNKLSIVFLMLFIIYSVYIFESRREVTGVESAYTAFYDWKTNYGIYPADWLSTLVNNGTVDSGLILNAMQTYYYITHGPSMFSKIVESSTEMGPYYGQFQVGILAPFIDKFLPALSMSDRITNEAVQVGVAGVFQSAWGMMYLDFGYLGLFVESFILGWICQIVYSNAIHKATLRAKLFFCFTLASILLSPMISPLAFSDSTFTIIAIVLFGIMLNSSKTNELR
jgi:oligosaccharide repeat unit polymerase